MTRARLDVCVLGSFMKDLVVHAPHRPRPGETVRGTGLEEFLGGKGVNQAVAAARAGARTAMIGRLGADRYGDEFTVLLNTEGIDATEVRRDENHGTGVGLPVVEPSGANSIIIVPRANDALCPADVARAASVIRSSKVFVAQLELSLDSVLTGLRLARDVGACTVLNPAPFVELPAEVSELVDILVPNEVEAERLTGISCDDDRAVEAAEKLCATFGRRAAVITLGHRGCVVVERAADGQEATWLPPHKVEPIDTVGAGDAFCGALAARLAAGDPLVRAATFANAAGALATTRAGAVPAMPAKIEVDALLAGEAT